jgi:hypothetical protein
MKSNLDRIQAHLEGIQDMSNFALDDLDASKYDEVIVQLEEIIERASLALAIMEDNEEFQND